MKSFLSKHWIVIGITLSIGYALIAIFFLWHNQKYSEHLKLSEVGDYLAGVFSPLAFLWLVIGYVMQNKELKNNVEQTSESINLARDQFEFIKKEKNTFLLDEFNKAQPVLTVESTLHIDNEIVYITITNSGSKITQLSFYYPYYNGRGKYLEDRHEDIFKNANIETLKTLREGESKYFNINIFSDDLRANENNVIHYPISFLDGNYTLQKTEIRIVIIKGKNRHLKLKGSIDTTRRNTLHVY